MWEGFDEFCRTEGLEQGMVRDLFKHEPEALADLRLLETGEIEAAEFERRFGALLGVADPDGLIERMFATVRPEERLIEAVRAARDAGVRTGLISNSWGTSIYDPDALEGLFDIVVISGEVGLHSHSRRSPGWRRNDSASSLTRVCSSTTCVRTSTGPSRWG
jgi:FMN phosphatase YigB (HAD superfamily)